MTGQLGSICDLMGSAENKHDHTSIAKQNPFGPNWDRVIISFRDPPPNQFTLPDDFSKPLLLIAAGSGIGRWLIVVTISVGLKFVF